MLIAVTVRHVDGRRRDGVRAVEAQLDPRNGVSERAGRQMSSQ